MDEQENCSTNKERNYYFRKYKATKCTIMRGKYRSLRNKVVASLRRLKCSFYMNLKPKSSKTFWKTVNTLSRSKSAIPTLTHDNVAVASNRGKAEVLNAHFTNCFNYSVPPIICGSWHYSTSDEISDLLCTFFFHPLTLTKPLALMAYQLEC